MVQIGDVAMLFTALKFITIMVIQYSCGWLIKALILAYQCQRSVVDNHNLSCADCMKIHLFYVIIYIFI